MSIRNKYKKRLGILKKSNFNNIKQVLTKKDKEKKTVFSSCQLSFSVEGVEGDRLRSLALLKAFLVVLFPRKHITTHKKLG
jgi:hypothetical protein